MNKLAMSIQTQNREGREYILFYYYENGKHRSLSLGRKGSPNVANIYKADAIVAEQRAKYESMHEKLLSLLPGEEIRRLQASKATLSSQLKGAMPVATLQVTVPTTHQGFHMTAGTKEEVERMATKLKRLAKELRSEKEE